MEASSSPLMTYSRHLTLFVTPFTVSSACASVTFAGSSAGKGELVSEFSAETSAEDSAAAMIYERSTSTYLSVMPSSFISAFFASNA